MPPLPPPLNPPPPPPPPPRANALPATAVLASARAATRVTTLCKRRFFIVDCLSIRCVGSSRASPDRREGACQAGAANHLSGYARNGFLDLAAELAELPSAARLKAASRALIWGKIGQLAAGTHKLPQGLPIPRAGKGLNPSPSKATSQADAPKGDHHANHHHQRTEPRFTTMIGAPDNRSCSVMMGVIEVVA